MNLTELKAAAFDAIRQVENWTKQLQEINKTILQAEAEQAKAEKKTPVRAEAKQAKEEKEKDVKKVK